MLEEIVSIWPLKIITSKYLNTGLEKFKKQMPQGFVNTLKQRPLDPKVVAKRLCLAFRKFILFIYFVVVAVVVCLLRIRYSFFLVVPSSSCRFPGTHVNSD